MAKTLDAYYGTILSEHLTQTPEGYLVCHNVPVARTGTQEYGGREIGLDTNDTITAVRNEDEVFSPATIASFEGKPFTDNHPADNVTIDDVASKMKGVIKNVKRGSGDDSDKIIADIMVYDKRMIDEILSGRKREISCGYDTEYVANGNGTYNQTKIRGNHVALVDKGRAGSSVSIKDNDNIKGGFNVMNFIDMITGKSKPMRKFIKDARPLVKDEASLAELVEFVEEFVESASPEVEANTATVDDPIEEMRNQINELNNRISAIWESRKGEDAVEERIERLAGEEDGSDELNAALSDEAETTPEEAAKEVVEMDEDETENETAMDALKKFAKDMRPMIAKLPVENRKEFNTMLTTAIKTNKATKDGYKEIQKAATQPINQYKTNADIVAGFAAYNPHSPNYKGGK